MCNTPIIKLYLEPLAGFDDDPSELVTHINVYEDRNQLYLNGSGQAFISIVHNIHKQLPTSLSQVPKSSDMLVIATKSFKKEYSSNETNKKSQISAS